MSLQCEGCAQRSKGLYIKGCECCEARLLARLFKRDRQTAYAKALARGEDVEALKRRVLAEWEKDQAERLAA